jgi:lipid II:glycine glycyltransferase (peptidoglycan interpeptide bridge formation enzyme)
MTKTLVRLARADEIDSWDELLQRNPDGGEILQTATMAEIKKSQGWKPEYWVYETSFGPVYAAVLAKNLLGFGRLCYQMRGPGVSDARQFAEIVRLNQAWEKSAFAIKMEPPISDTIKTSQTLRKVRNIQPNADTIVVDLTASEEAILAGFRQRARREIRAAERDGVTVKKMLLDDQTIDQMFDLYRTTGERAGFFVRPKSYYVDFWRRFAAAGEGDLYFAYAPDEANPIAGAFICRLGHKALYKDGGSRRSGAKHFAHLLQWKIMKELKQQGVKAYDLHGVPPADQLDNPDHPQAGLATFKLSFAQTTTNYAGAFDQVLQPKAYQRWAKYGQRLHQAAAHHLGRTTLY